MRWPRVVLSDSLDVPASDVKLPWSDGLVLVVMRWPRVVLSDSLDVPASDVKLPWSDGLVTSCDEMASCCAV